MKNKLTVIYYHEVVENGQGFSYQKIEIDKFEAQMKFLHDNGYKSLWFSELNEPLPKKAIIVSFDDGFLSVYKNAVPIMRKYGIKGNVYLPTAYIGTNPQYMHWDAVREISNDFEFQAHTHNHLDIRTLSVDDLNAEIENSDKCFKENLGFLPIAFCMPYGAYDKRSLKALRGTGRYKYILASYYGTVKNLNKRVFARIGISNDDTLKVFEGKLKGKYNFKGLLQRLRLFVKNLKKERITEYSNN